MNRGARRVTYAMLPSEIITSLSPSELKLFSYLDLRCGPRGTWPAKGWGSIATGAGMSRATAMRAGRALERFGLVEIKDRGDGAKCWLTVAHNPARGLVNPNVSLPGDEKLGTRPEDEHDDELPLVASQRPVKELGSK